MLEINTQKKYYIPLLATSVISVLFIFLPFKPKPFGDGEYHEGAKLLIQYVLNGFDGPIRIDKGLATVLYYTIPYSLVYFLKSETTFYYAGVVFNIITILIGTFYLLRTLYFLNISTSTVYLTTILLLVFPIHIYYSMGILAEPPAFALVSIFFYFWTRTTHWDSSPLKNYTLIGLIIGLLISIRPNLLPFAILFLIFSFFKIKKLKNYIITTFTFVITLISLGFIESRINTVSADFKEIVFRNQLVWSRFELRDEPFNWIPQHGINEYSSVDYLNNLEKRRELDSICETNNINKTSFFIKWTIKDIKENPLLTIRQYTLKFFQSQIFIISQLIRSNKNPMLKYGIHIAVNMVNLIVLILAVMGIIELFKKRNYGLLIPILLLWSWLFIYICIFHSEQRYMFPLRPLLFILAAVKIESIYLGKRFKFLFFEKG
jgi:hypothetical protein